MADNNLQPTQVSSQAQGKRGRPRKVLTDEDIFVLQQKKARGRGRPKKERTAEEVLMAELRHQRGKGRPKKNLSPQQEWVARFAPAKLKGRPKKDFVLDMSLPTINQNIKQNLVAEKEVETTDRGADKKESKFSWAEFIQKIPTANVADDYIFPIETVAGEQKNQGDVKRKVVVKADAPSEYVIDLRHGNYQPAIEEKVQEEVLGEALTKEYVWEAKKSEDQEVGVDDLKKQDAFLKFSVPEDAGDEQTEIRFNQLPKDKKRKTTRAKIGLVSDGVFGSVETKKYKEKNSWLDVFLVGLGKVLYFIWRVITAPFRFLDFVVDRTLKGVWFGGRWLAAVVFKVFKLNFLYFKKIFQLLNPKFSKSNLDVADSSVLLKPMLSFLAVCLIIVLPLVGWHGYKKASQLKGDVLGVSQLGVDYLKQGATTAGSNDLQAALLNFAKAGDSFSVARQKVEELGLLAGMMMKLVPEARDGERLLKSGELAAEIGQELTRALAVFNGQSVVSASEKICNSLPGEEQKCFAFDDLDLTDKVTHLKNIFDLQRDKIDELIDNLTAVDRDNLPIDYQSQFEIFKQSATTVETATGEISELLAFMRDFLGADEAKRYLIVFQNSNELRPTGGFMGSFAVVDIKHGNVEKMEIPGGGLYDLKASNQLLVAAPKPLQIFSPAWQIWNANWWPDFKMSAEKIMWFYENTTNGSTVDGVLALTDDVVSDLLQFTGPIAMADYEVTLSAANFTSEVQQQVEIDYDKQQNSPKQIIADMAPELLSRLFSLEADDLLKVTLNLNQALTEEKILFYFNDQEQQARAKKFGWTGESYQLKDSQDYLMVVHTNISGGKTDGVIDNNIRHKVTVEDDGSLLVTVNLTRKHNGDKDNFFEADHNVDYVRFYVPLGAEFLGATGFNFNPSYLFKYAAAEEGLLEDEVLKETDRETYIDEQTGMRIGVEADKTVFGNWLQVSVGDEVTATIRYKLPFSLAVNNGDGRLQKWLNKFSGKDRQLKYSLIVEKQPGMDEQDFSSSFILPTGFNVEDVLSGGQVEVVNNEVVFSNDLLTDNYYGLVLVD